MVTILTQAKLFERGVRFEIARHRPLAVFCYDLLAKVFMR
jgi:hypothetical protein